MVERDLSYRYHRRVCCNDTVGCLYHIVIKPAAQALVRCEHDDGFTAALRRSYELGKIGIVGIEYIGDDIIERIEVNMILVEAFEALAHFGNGYHFHRARYLAGLPDRYPKTL